MKRKSFTFNLRALLMSFLLVTLCSIDAVASESAVKLGYCSENIQGTIGTNKDLETGAAIYITPAMAKPLKGCTISAVRVGLGTTSKLSVFVVKTLAEAQDAAQTVSSYAVGWNEVALDTPYTIDDDGFYIGYNAKGTSPIGISDRASADGDWLSISGGNWADYSSQFDALCIQGLMTGEFPLDMSINLNGDIITKVNQPSILKGSVTSKTTIPIENYEITYTIGTSAPVSVFFDKALATNEESEFSIEIPGMSEDGKYNLTATVTKINGEAIEKDVFNSATIKFLNRENLFPRKVVAEEGTGTWCGACPRGIVGMKYMKEKYPDTFIGIAVHYDDSFAVTSYRNFLSKYIKSYPNAIVNRITAYATDPNKDYLEAVYQEIMVNPYADGDISMTAAFTDDTYKAITVSTKTVFADSYDDADFRIAYVVLENQLPAVQTNGYAGGAYGVMGGFESLGSAVKVNLDDVARGIYPSYTGEANSVPSVITKGESYDHDYDVTLPNISNISNVELVALLINNKTNEIVNATKASLAELTSVNSVSSDNDVKVYAVDGKVLVSTDYTAMDVYGTNGLKVPNENLLQGVYVVKVVVDGKTIVKKIAL